MTVILSVLIGKPASDFFKRLVKSRTTIVTDLFGNLRYNPVWV